MDKGGFAGSGGSVGPDAVGWIELGGEHKTILTAETLQLVRLLGVIQPSVDGDYRVFLEVGAQPLVDGGVIAHILFHHHETTVGQFDFGLQEIA